MHCDGVPIEVIPVAKEVYMTSEVKTRTSTWTIDPAHSIVEFAVKHLVVSTVKGRFRKFQGTLQIDEEKLENSSVEASIEVASIDTGEPERDAHLLSDDFFNAEKYPYITFKSTRVERIDDHIEHVKVWGNLTMRDVTKEIPLDVEYEGRIIDPWGKDRASFFATTQLKRKEFGLKWDQLMETGGAVVSNEVKVELHIEAVRENQEEGER
jgi:polyisoprenoid-binding protein YceI